MNSPIRAASRSWAVNADRVVVADRRPILAVQRFSCPHVRGGGGGSGIGVMETIEAAASNQEATSGSSSSSASLRGISLGGRRGLGGDQRAPHPIVRQRVGPPGDFAQGGGDLVEILLVDTAFGLRVEQGDRGGVGALTAG